MRSSMTIKALGVVYGDIGTSPIYTLAIIFALVPLSEESVMSVLSLVFWTMMILVSVQYAYLATALSRRGEGGTVVLVQLLRPYLHNAKLLGVISLLGYLGLSLMIGDGVITPAISILSAVEGFVLIPGYEQTPRLTLLIAASIIAFLLFSIQRNGVERVASAFGPIMLVWFVVLGAAGVSTIVYHPQVLWAINPAYALHFGWEHPMITFIMLADVLLAATGGEALYADMGHLGRRPILKGWALAWSMLILSYYGQGAFLLDHPEALKSPLFGMMHAVAPSLYVPFLLLAIMATVIASQAMISGIFSVVYQAMNTRIFPHFRVEYTSYALRSQIYVESVNWFLFGFVVVMLFVFGESSKLAAAYGLAVAGAMSITGVLMSMIFALQRRYGRLLIALFSGGVSILFFLSCWLKLPHGGYWSLVIAAIPFGLILLYTQGQKRLYHFLPTLPQDAFIDRYTTMYRSANHIQGVGLFFSRRAHAIPAYIAKTMFGNGIVYERNIIVSVKPTNEPTGVHSELSPLSEGLELLIVYVGYMEILNVEALLRTKGIDERSIFYGEEEIISSKPWWKLFALIKRLSPSFANFYQFPHEKLIGVSRRVEI